MLATIGFLTAAVLLCLFAYTFYRLVKGSDTGLGAFGLAYSLIAAAFLMWGLLSLANSTGELARSVLVGDGLLLAASILSASVFMPPRWKKPALAVLTVAAIVLLYARSKYYYPVPSLKQSVLFFNTQRPVAVLLSAIVVIAWLPACMKAARIVTGRAGLQRYYPLFVSTYFLTIISAVLFIEARRRTIVIDAFIAFTASILLLLVSNVLAQSGTNNTKAGRHAAR